MAPRAGVDRGAVVQAAVRLADARPGEDISLTELATALGIRTPSLYNHVAGQDGLRRELTLLGLHDMATHLGKAVMGREGDPAIRALAHAYRTFAKEHPGLYGRTLHAPAPDDTAHIAAGEEVIEIILAVLRSYNLTGDTAIHVIRGLRSLLHGFVSLELNGGFGIPLDLDDSFNILIDMFIAGLRRPTRAAG